MSASNTTVNMKSLKEIRDKQKETAKVAKSNCKDSLVIKCREKKILIYNKISVHCLKKATICRDKNNELTKELKELTSKL